MPVTAEADEQQQQPAVTPAQKAGEAPKGRAGTPASLAAVCPACGGVNALDAIFCGNPACHKALGDFKYVLEELREKRGGIMS